MGGKIHRDSSKLLLFAFSELGASKESEASSLVCTDSNSQVSFNVIEKVFTSISLSITQKYRGT